MDSSAFAHTCNLPSTPLFRLVTAEVSTVNRKTALYELATVAAVLRVASQEADDGAGAGKEAADADESSSQ